MEFKKPKAMIYMDLATPFAYHSPRSAVYTRLFTAMVEDVLNEYSYEAELAGLHYSLSNTAKGMQLLVSGYNHKLAELLKAIVGKIARFGEWADPQRFTLLKDQSKRSWANFYKGQPYGPGCLGAVKGHWRFPM